MDILPAESLDLIIFVVKILGLVAGIVIFAINFFHQKEAKKMAERYNLQLPGSVSFAMSLQTFLSLAFLITVVLLLFLPAS